jgi:hypothetical protein
VVATFARVSLVLETVDDLNVAFEDLRGGGDAAQQRRALKATLDNLYRVREHRREAGGYFARSDSCDSGRVTEGITYLRGVLTHHVAKPVAPERQPLYPGENLYPSEDLFPGSNLTWLSANDVLKVHPPTTKRDHVLFDFYRSHVGDRMVLPTLRAARDFLVNDPKLGPL